MSAVKRGQAKAPVLPQEVVPVEAIGGDVIVRGLLMSEHMAITALIMQAGKPLAGETEEGALIRARAQRVAMTLARTVVLEDGKPLWTIVEWDVFGCTNPLDALTLFNVAKRLNGMDEEASEKN